jgi:hypothetical protein
MLSKTLYTSVVKFPASTSEHIMKTLFQFVAMCKMLSHVANTLQGQTGCSRRMPDVGCEQDGEEHRRLRFCDCLTRAAGVRPGIVVKEKDVFHVSVRTNSTEALSQFV